MLDRGVDEVDRAVNIEGRRASDATEGPPRDELGQAIRAGAELDPIEARMAMRRVRAALTKASAPEAPVRIGRHLVVRMIATGGFGVVYEAFDPELDRRLAVKVLRSDVAGPSGTGGMLLEEARALAKVSHPNVVAVFDVGVMQSPGEDEERVFLAMEMVGGESLRDWLERERPGWRAVVERFRAAGEGLAAAHEAGIVHRDFKPANVLVGEDGRVRVADFGLAIPREQGAREEEDASGTVSGTPAYMAPEQHWGEPAGVRTDVYSFCVSLYQGLYGELPFRSRSYDELADLKRAPPTVPGDRRVPTWLRQLVLRGMDPVIDARVPTMRQLLDELDRHLSSRRWVWALAGVVTAGAVGLGYSMGAEPSAGSGVDVCAELAHEAAAGVWEADAIEASRTAFRATELSFADTAWQSTAKALDDHLERWRARRRELCEAKPFLERNAPQLLEHRRACLDGRLHEVEALVAELATADRTVVERSVRAVYGLGAPDACADETLAPSTVPPEDPIERQRFDDLQVRLARVRLLRAFGRYDRLEPELEALREELPGLAYAPLRAEIQIELGHGFEVVGDAAQAERMLMGGVLDAEAAGMTQQTAAGKARLVWLVGHVMGRHEEAMVWASNAESAIGAARASAVDTRRLEARYLNALAAIHFSRGEYDQAGTTYQRVRELDEALDGAEHPSTIRAMSNLGSVHFAKGDLQEAEALFRRTLEQRERVLGADHPDTATTLANLGSVAQESGRHQEAREIAEQVLHSRLAVHGSEHSMTARAHYQLAVALAGAGELDAAREHHEQALRVLRAAVGEGHPDISLYISGLASTIQRQGQLEEAEALYREALAHVQEHFGGEHPNAAYAHLNLGDCLRRQGRLGEAEASHRAALRLLDAVDPQHPRSVLPRLGLALVLTVTGRAEEALPHIRRAQEITAMRGQVPERLALIDMVLGMARWELDDDRAGARRLVEDARALFASDPALRVESEDAHAWLASHPAP